LNPRQVLEKKKEPLNEAVSYLTAEIETLQKRLSEYDKELSSKLVETQKPAE
jgi:chaperonin cofactor prefoldin